MGNYETVVSTRNSMHALILSMSGSIFKSLRLFHMARYCATTSMNTALINSRFTWIDAAGKRFDVYTFLIAF